MIIGLMGKIGSGKDTVASYLCEKYGFVMIGYGDLARKIATKRCMEHNRANLMSIVSEHIDKFGTDYFSKLMVKEIREHTGNRIVINGVRQVSDATELIDGFQDDVLLIYIYTSENNRYIRMKERNRPGDPETFDEFTIQDDEERESFNTDKTFEMANITLENNDSEQSLFSEIDDIISRFIKNKNSHTV